MPTSKHSPPAIAVMYHYVRPDGQSIPGGIRPMLASEFEKQLDWLEQYYSIIPAVQFLNWIIEKTDLPRPPCLLTFDDGTRDHAEVITPILARRGLSGVFFILTGPAEEGLMPLTHAIHWLLGQSNEETWQLFEQYATDELDGRAALGDPAEARRIYHYEPKLRPRIKYAANMAMPAAATNAIVHRAAEQAGLSLAHLAKEWFVSADQITAMHRSGMTIGLHGHSHSSLQVLGAEGIRREIAHGSDYLESLTGVKPTWWACPFGGNGASASVIAAMHNAMNRAGLRAAFTTRKSPITVAVNPLELPRYDCIDLPPEKAVPPPELEIS